MPKVHEISVPTRRFFLRHAGLGLGALALGELAGNAAPAAADPAGIENPLAPKDPHYAPRAKRVIYMFMAGAPSQLDLFEHKPKLQELDNQPIPESFIAGEQFAFLRGTPKILGSPYRFQQHGESGAWVSELLPHTAGIVDDIAFVRSLHTEQFNHVTAQLLVNTGSPRMGRPSMGSWVTYGLGSESQDLPGFVVLASGKAGRCGTSCWNSGFLPTTYQGVEFRSEGDPVLFLSNPPGMDDPLRRASLDTIRSMNERALLDIGDPEIATRINSFEMAYKMQASVPELMDISEEPRHIHELYGTEPGKVSFSNNCLLARRMIERGVRFVQLYHGGWDHHGGSGDQNLATNLPERCRQVDQGAAALVQDLKQRGLLEDTLVVWGGEFGRTPMLQGEKKPDMLGRDHHRKAFTLWMAGAGVKPGFSLGETDEFGYNITADPVHVHDFQATVLHLLGVNHEKLTYRFQGRDFRLTDVHGKVIDKLLS